MTAASFVDVDRLFTASALDGMSTEQPQEIKAPLSKSLPLHAPRTFDLPQFYGIVEPQIYRCPPSQLEN